MGTTYDLTQVDLYQEFENWRIHSLIAFPFGQRLSVLYFMKNGVKKYIIA